MPHRRLPSPRHIEIGDDRVRQFGEPEAAMLSLNPPGFAGRVTRESVACPVCGRDATELDRLAASHDPIWAGRSFLGFGVWVHADCFAACIAADGPKPIPW